MNNSIMKYFITTILILGIFACKPSSDSSVIPEDLEGKRSYLTKKKKELKDLQASIAQVSKEIDRLDPPKEKKALQVRTQKLAAKEFKRYVNVQAQIVAEDIVNASSEIGGRIMSLNVREGNYVNKGQVIATTDMSTVETQIAEIKTSLDLATTVYERQERLWNQKIGSEMQYLEAKTNKERLEKSLATINSQISKKNVYAPISGIVDKEFLSQGETAGPGMPIIQILNTSNIKVVADLQESMLGSVKRGDMVEVYFPSLDKTTKKQISMIGRTIDPANRTFKIEISTGSMNGQLKPNLLAQVKFNDLSQKNAVLIPINVVQEDVGGNKFVFVTKKDGDKLRAEKRLIELGESNGDEAIVIIGLEVDDTLITSGGMSLSDNDLINPITTTENNG